ncbi:MAG: hypothetical protein MjAS7_0583 [Metallosphaera javensis (ex Sakai et al. 2022)]|nr:MAG: hypothetical protein MjAS7_0583 [Metallosphaera javensis (ex Sakai et al. 2022)]
MIIFMWPIAGIVSVQLSERLTPSLAGLPQGERLEFPQFPVAPCRAPPISLPGMLLNRFW